MILLNHSSRDMHDGNGRARLAADAAGRLRPGLYGSAAKGHLPVLEDCLNKFSNHKDYNGCIKPPLEKAIAAIKAGEK